MGPDMESLKVLTDEVKPYLRQDLDKRSEHGSIDLGMEKPSVSRKHPKVQCD